MDGDRTQAAGLPVGTVAFLLTDVEGSTRAWELEPDTMAQAIARHYAILDEAISLCGGIRPMEQGEGDSVVGAFARASDAVLAALTAQRQLTAEAWPTTDPVRVRMAIHVGEALLRDELNYVGNAIIRTARLRAAGHGGQVLVSNAAKEAATKDDMSDAVGFLDLGVHRLKDLALPEHVWQLTHGALPREFPSLRSLDAVPNNLPIALSSFIGRSSEIDSVVRLILDNRFVTLTGAGGAGKTRLAQQVACEVVERFPDGVWWVDLVGVTEDDLVASAVSRAMLLPEDQRDRVGGLARRIAGRRALLVLDNCEHLLEGSVQLVAAIVARCPDMSVLATSRASLNLPGELSWRIPSFSLDDAVRLFADRAARAHDGFRLDASNEVDVRAICTRLDGIPLAIELAAARTRVLSPAEILNGLDDSISLLAGGGRGVVPHHQTIQASIAWSHSLLDDSTQRLFRRLGVFASPFSLDGVRALVTDDDLFATNVVDGVERLVEHSLIHRHDQSGSVRFRMLETVRQFAQRELETSGEADTVTARHAQHFMERGRGLWPLFHTGMTEILDEADVEFEDLTVMFAYLEQHASPERHAEIAIAALPAMSVRRVAEAARLADRAIARVDDMTVLGGELRLQMAIVDPSNQEHVGKGLAAAEATGDPGLAVHARYWSSWSQTVADPRPSVVADFGAIRDELSALGETHFSKTYWTSAALDRSVGRHASAVRALERAKTETQCKRCNVMVWSEAVLLALAFGDLGAAEDAMARARAFGVEVRDSGFFAAVRLAETELAVYAGRDWPARDIDAELVGADGHPMVVGYLHEAQALGALAEGRIPDDADTAQAIELIDDMFGRRSEARLRRAIARHAAGDLDGAAEVLDDLRALAAAWEAGPWLTSQIDQRAAGLALERDDVAEADDLAHGALAAATVGPWPPLIVRALETLASVAAQRESHVEAARLAGAAARIREEIGFRLALEPDRTRLAAHLEMTREALDDVEHERAYAEGQRLTMSEAVAYARRARGERKRPSHGWDALTPTERQVADLALDGKSNAQIADRLFIGRETVKTHLSNVYAKVGVANRTQLVADAAKRGITS